MEETFADAGVSITVTSLTDFISFAVGCATPFPSVQMFCAYAVTAVVFTYIYQLTFFAGIMVYTNHRSFEKNHVLSQFFRTTYSDMLLNPFVRAIIIVAFFAYLTVAIWGCTEVKLGLEPNDLLPDNSYGKQTLRLAEKYFADYGSSLHVWMYNLSKVDIGPRRMWSVLDKEIELYENTEFTGAADSWLRTFLQFVKQSGLLITQENFVYILKNVFLTQPQYGKYRRHVGCANQSRAMMLFRKLAETSLLPTGVYADFFQFAEQYNAVLPGTLTSIAYAGAAVIIVSLFLIPEPVASLWVSFSILSINIGILGFMTFWDVRLDFISMVTIVMQDIILVQGRNVPPSERMRNALYAVGAPILQSATSTILGVSFLASAESYVFRSFLKTIFLVILLGGLLLTMFHCSCGSGGADAEPESTEVSTTASPPPPSANLKYLASPDLYRFKLAEQPHCYLEYLKDLGRPPDYHEAAAPPYPMRARLKYPKFRETSSVREESEYFYQNRNIQVPR
ncbi:unnamed protein product [Nippostrongylus brasiliensis]|uniref:SSD domain-containing protein n=1 Tax=Nippostrongylus brasiliensis TaxID=27835 RepID=A0A158QZW2_NIPBR|nr:unnamed protein product [Nippostrongylus brasiliensis]